MLHVIGTYLGVVGGVAAGAQVARGAVRGVARLARGDARGALVEVAGGVTAPVVAAVNQLSQLGSDVYRSVSSRTSEVRQKAGSNATPTTPRVPPRRRRASAVAINGAAT